MPTAYKWHPITDLDDDWASLSDGELEPLKRVWDGQKPQLVETGAFDEFDKQLRREWAIETGIIENVYTLDRGVTQTLIERGIDAALIPRGATNRAPELVARIIQDHYEALDGMFDFVKGQRNLSTGYIKELHAAMLRNQERYAVVDQFGNAFEKRLDKGKYKSESNSPTRPDGFVHEYCPPEHVASEMDRLVELHAAHESPAVPPEIEAAWLHHRFAQIHPFADGNGRVARALASLVFIKAGWFPLIVQAGHWTRYIDALERADSGDLRPLVSMFVEAQRDALIQIIQSADGQSKNVSHDDGDAVSAEEAIAAARDLMLRRGVLRPDEWRLASDTGTELVQFVLNRFKALSSQLSSQMSGKNFAFSAFQNNDVAYDGPSRQAWESAFHGESPWKFAVKVNLNLYTGQNAGLVIVFNQLGRGFRGIIGVVAYLRTDGPEPTPLDGGAFQINYEEDSAHTTKRFSDWLERIIVEGLNAWRKTL